MINRALRVSQLNCIFVSYGHVEIWKSQILTRFKKVTFQQSLFLKIVSDLRQVSGFLPVSSTNNTDRHDLTEILLKVVSKKPNLFCPLVYWEEYLMYWYGTMMTLTDIEQWHWSRRANEQSTIVDKKSVNTCNIILWCIATSHNKPILSWYKMKTKEKKKNILLKIDIKSFTVWR